MKNYKLDNDESIKTLSQHPLLNNARLKTANSYQEFSRLVDKVTPEFLKFIEFYDPHTYTLLSAILNLNEAVGSVLVSRPKIMELINLVNSKILPMSPHSEFLDAIRLVNELKS